MPQITVSDCVGAEPPYISERDAVRCKIYSNVSDVAVHVYAIRQKRGGSVGGNGESVAFDYHPVPTGDFHEVSPDAEGYTCTRRHKTQGLPCSEVIAVD